MQEFSQPRYCVDVLESRRACNHGLCRRFLGFFRNIRTHSRTSPRAFFDKAAAVNRQTVPVSPSAGVSNRAFNEALELASEAGVHFLRCPLRARKPGRMAWVCLSAVARMRFRNGLKTQGVQKHAKHQRKPEGRHAVVGKLSRR